MTLVLDFVLISPKDIPIFLSTVPYYSFISIVFDRYGSDGNEQVFEIFLIYYYTTSLMLSLICNEPVLKCNTNANYNNTVLL